MTGQRQGRAGLDAERFDEAIVGQVRTVASDVLQATGMDRAEALRRIREVAAAQS